MECIFCEILDGKRPAHVIHEDDMHLAFLDKYPIDHGHSLVIPKAHHERITDMQSDAVGELFSRVPRVAGAILAATGADAFSLGQNNGREAKQIVPHVHVHIIPRYRDRGTVWTKRGIAKESELEDLAEKIRSRV